MQIPLPNDIITPKKSALSYVKETTKSNKRYLICYSFRPDKKSDYLSHTYLLDKNNTGTEFVFDEKGTRIAQLPIYHGRLHGEGYFFDSSKSNGEVWYFFHGFIFSKTSNDQLKSLGEIIPEMLEMQADLIGLSKKDLLKKRPPEYIFNRKEKEMNFIFKPVAQNTIIRPLAEAVCMMHGGSDTSYTDPTDKKVKYISYGNLHTIIGLETVNNGRKVRVNGDLIAFHAKNHPEKTHLKVEINDVLVCVTPRTTVAEALAQFHRKLHQKNKMDAQLFGRQKD